MLAAGHQHHLRGHRAPGPPASQGDPERTRRGLCTQWLGFQLLIPCPGNRQPMGQLPARLCARTAWRHLFISWSGNHPALSLQEGPTWYTPRLVLFKHPWNCRRYQSCYNSNVMENGLPTTQNVSSFLTALGEHLGRCF